MRVEDMSSVAFENADAIKAATKCGCYRCCAVVPSSDVVTFVDEGKTGLCPNCGVDSLLPDVTDVALLEQGRSRWFGKSHRG